MRDAVVRGVFDQAVDLPPDLRSAFLDGACQDDPELRGEVEELLAADARAAKEDCWHRSALHNQIIADGSGRSAVGETVGRYRLVELIGRGGMGAVYRADRIDAEFEHCVAVKLIDGLFNSAEIIGHFRAERQILAQLNHPNIAHLLDGGTRADGMPFLVMEFVSGVNLAEYCHAKALSTAERLALFCHICAAVHYAHQHMIVHRDLKPANILVTADGTPKLLDFGIAKIVEPDPLCAPGTRTTRGMVPLTARYASPEQIRGEPVTTASDIYSLGVILYELLCGHSPYGDEERPPYQIMSAVCDETPPRPSSLAPKLRGDLDNVGLRALRKAPSERYASAGHFAEDIRRYLEGRPVEAHGDAPLYVASKFVRRNWAVTLVAALLLLLLVGGLAMVNAARTRADRRFSETRQLAHAVLFDYAGAIDRLPGALPVRRQMVKDALVYLDRLSADANTPDLQRDVVNGYTKVADVEGNEYQNNLGDTAAALSSAQKAVSEADRLLAKDRSLASLEAAALAFATDGSVRYSAGDLPHADVAYRRALHLRGEIALSVPRDIDNQIAITDCLDHLGDLYGGADYPNLGKPLQSMRYYDQAKSFAAQLAARYPDNLLVAKERYETLITLSGSEAEAGQWQEAMRDLVAARTVIGNVLAMLPNDTDVEFELANVEGRIGRMQIERSDPAAAIFHFRHALAELVQLRKSDASSATFRRGESMMENGMAAALRAMGRFSAGVAHNRKAVQLAQALSHNSPESAQYRMDLGNDERRLAEGLLAARAPAEAWHHAELAIAILCASSSSRGNTVNHTSCDLSRRAADLAHIARHEAPSPD